MSKFAELLRLAIGDNTQKEFAEKAGISKYSLNHMLNDDERIPQRGTIKKIAEASEGRVSEKVLMAACRYDFPGEDDIMSIAMDYKKGFQVMSGAATKYNSLDDFADSVQVLYGKGETEIYILKEQEFNGKGKMGAENFCDCEIRITTDKYFIIIPFIIFFCKTVNGGYIVSCCDFDLLTLWENQHFDAGKFLMDISSKGDVDMSDYPIVIRKVDRLAAEKRLLNAIFGDDFR